MPAAAPAEAAVVPLLRAAGSAPDPALFGHPLDVDRRADWHTHSSGFDGAIGASVPAAMADAALAAGLRAWSLTDRVRAADTWLVEYAAAVRRIRRDGLTVRCGVEVTVLDQAGHLDMPGRLPFLDHAVVTVAALPTRTGPVDAAGVRDRLRTGALGASDVVDLLVTATDRAIRNCPARPVVGRAFSLLPQVGIDDAFVTDDHVHALAAACRATYGAVELNETWRAPSARVATALAAAGVSLVAGSDATTCREVGAWRWIAGLTGTACTDLATVLALDEFEFAPRPQVDRTLVAAS